MRGVGSSQIPHLPSRRSPLCLGHYTKVGGRGFPGVGRGTLRGGAATLAATRPCLSKARTSPAPSSTAASRAPPGSRGPVTPDNPHRTWIPPGDSNPEPTDQELALSGSDGGAETVPGAGSGAERPGWRHRGIVGVVQRAEHGPAASGEDHRHATLVELGTWARRPAHLVPAYARLVVGRYAPRTRCGRRRRWWPWFGG